MQFEIEKRLKGSLKGAIWQELFTNSLHFPLANIILELLLESPGEYLSGPDFYVITLASLIQAFFLGRWRYHGKPNRLIGNVLGPAIYSIVEMLIEGADFFASPNHIAYWIFSLLIGGLQELEAHLPGRWAELVTVLEHLVRTCILLVMYAIFETLTAENRSFSYFWTDNSHVFIAIVIILLGFIVGFAHVTSARYLALLQSTAKQLRMYSEWLLGKNLLSAAIQDADALSLQRIARTVLFMDIRGFTAWSERTSPERVVAMLNRYFETAETLWKDSSVIKVKHTGDEIMAVFPTAADAVKTAFRFQQTIGVLLQEYELSAGIGLHAGDLVEGLIGSQQVKAYDIIGDTVNTAKRICDQAKGREILISESVYHAIEADCSIEVVESKSITMKGKSAPLPVFVIRRRV
ncbi:adenylyl cyclase class-3/4/guanylyl cyclase [Candidatus Moduliflexus flocculans]|uniref:Adenylyl cyclase class-3/4/guanylyl cyclase n=1 Tax=Candidatus Moduliflexus flocculans TaxID=1499966 RepID=A0A0S6VSI1_9BACT|nr:adenylyl cyclase class-3/4/guanylyl cyclase [Candidatus Moduliflexus flocculans]